MIKRVWVQSVFLLSLSLSLVSCGGGGGSPASPPTVSGTAGDGQVRLTWTALSGIYYWLFFTQSNQTFDIANPPNVPQQGFIGINPTYVVGNLTNGLSTSMIVNAHAGNVNGPGGPGSNDIIAIPRLAGGLTTWSACSSNCPAATLNAVAFGDSGNSVADSSTIHVYMGAGNDGKVYYSTEGLTWSSYTTGTCNTANNALHGVAYNNSIFYVVGAGGTLCYTNNLTTVVDANNNWAPSSATWAVASSQPDTSTTLYSIAGSENYYGANLSSNFVAVGSSGTVGSTGAVWNTTDYLHWNSVFSAAHDLYAVSYTGNCNLSSNAAWIAVGNSGVIVDSTTSGGNNTWANAASVPNIGSINLKGVACSPNTTLYTVSNQVVTGPSVTTPLVVAVGDNATVLTSSDGVNWIQPTVHGISGNLTSVYALNRGIESRSNNTQFVAINDVGQVFVSTDGINWTNTFTAASGVSLKGITSTLGSNVPNGSFGSVPFSYVAVGSSTAGYSAISQ